MAQSTILAAGTTAAQSTDVVIIAGVPKVVGLFVATGALDPGVECVVALKTPGADTVIGKLSKTVPAIQLSGPGTYRVIRKAVTVAVGVYLEA